MTVSNESKYGSEKNEVHDEEYVFPASYAQKRMWFLDQFEPNSPYYNIPLSFILRGRINLEKLKMSFYEIIRRHESLRTTFGMENGECIQIVSSIGNVDINVQKLVLGNSENVDEYLKNYADKEAKKPFNLTTGPLLRINIIVVSENEIAVYITMHHIISDGWSVGILFNEIITIYKSYVKELESPLDELEIQYVDYSEWQRERFESGELVSQLSYWKNNFENLPPIVTIPPDFIRPNVYSNKGSSVTKDFSKELTGGIKRIAAKNGVTEFMFLLCAFKVLLHKYTGESDICIGTPIANRLNKASEKIIGLFINTLVLRTDLSENQTFENILKVLKLNTIAAYENQEVPFEMVVDQVQPDRDTKYSPLFQIMFIFQNISGGNQKLDDLEISMIDSNMGTSTFDLSISVSITDDRYSLEVEFNSDLYKKESIKSVFEHYELLLLQVVDNYKINIDDISLLNDFEETKILNEWNNSKETAKSDENIISLFEKTANKYPNNNAIEYFCENNESHFITYSDLSQKIDSLAEFLVNSSEYSCDTVAISFDRSAYSVIAILAILKSGKNYLPIDPEYPKERIDYFINDSNTQTVITSKSQSYLFEEKNLNIILIDDFDFTPVTPNSHKIYFHEQSAYKIYTSGSTGLPKSVEVTHKNLYNYVSSAQNIYNVLPSDRALQFASISFDTAIEEIFTTLCAGATLIIRTHDWISTIEGFINHCKKHKITILNFPTAFWHQLIDEISNNNLPLYDELKLIILGGEKAVHSKLKEWYKRFGLFPKIINTYGPTETTIVATSWEMNKNWGESKLLSEVPIGKPLDFISAYIVDRKVNLVGAGITGELLIGGDSVANGYNNRAELTAEKFIPDPFSNIPGSRLYRTGDLCKFSSDGTIKYIGRADNQVKFRGFRIETGEIENVILGFEGIKSTTVIFIEWNKSKVLHSFLVCEKDINLNDLMEFIITKLPSYMIPNSFSFIEKIPLTKNGKVDKRTLAKFYNEKDNSKVEDQKLIEASDDIENKLVEIWKEVLNIDKVGVNQNFFNLGGHSLLAIQILSRIKDSFDKELSLKKFFLAPTIKNLAVELKSLSKSEEVVIPRYKNKTKIPLSYAQERLWFLDQLSENSIHYNLPQVLRITGRISIEYFKNAINKIISKHEILRTHFIDEDGLPYQVVNDDYELPFFYSDLSNLSDIEKKEKSDRLIFEEVNHKFTLSQLPLFRVLIIRMGHNEIVISFVIHHILADEWSLKVLANEFVNYYNVQLNELDINNDSLEIQYGDYSAWQKSYLNKELLEKKLAYWKNKLSGSIPLLNLPTDYPRPSEKTFNGNYKTFSINNELNNSFSNLSTKNSISHFVIYLAIFNILLKKYSSQDEIIVGTPVANRTMTQTENLIGFFVNTIAIKSHIQDELSFVDYVNQLNNHILDDLENQDVPFEKIVDAVESGRNLSISPIFQVMFVFQSEVNQNLNNYENPEIHVEPINPPTKSSKFDITLFLNEQGNLISGAIEYNTDLFSENKITSMIQHFSFLFESIGKNLNQKIGSLNLFDQHNEYKILNKLTNDENKLSSIKNVHEEIDDIARKYPNNAALKLNGKELSYSSMISKANQLANYLVDKNIKTEDRIGICVDRSFNQVISLVAALKMGATYIPIDPQYPINRIKYMLEDSGAKSIIFSEKYKTLFNEILLDKINLDEINNTLDERKCGFKNKTLFDESLAYIIYTSGSTGQPKGVMIDHKGLRNYLEWCKHEYPISANSGSVLHSTIAFDATITSIFPSLICGAPIHIIDSTNEINEMAELIAKENVGALKITPAHLELLSFEMESKGNKAVPESLVVGGENLTAKQIKYFSESEEVKIYNEYGPTETVVGCVVFEASKWNGNYSVPIGKVISGMRIYVLNNNLCQIPVGIDGELFIGGRGVARGYVNKPEITAEKFLPDLYSKNNGERVYKTGDIVRILEDGNLLFIGRKDDQVKLRGYRIELSEIESELNKHNSVRETVVDIKTDFNNNQWLVAYVTLRNGFDLDENELKNQLGKQLPNYMIPSIFVQIDEIPLTVNGKVNKKLLPEINSINKSIEGEIVAPSSLTENAIAGIWSKLLNLEKIGVNSNFFLLGGHSLLVTQLVSRINKEFNVRLSIKDIFEYSTIQEQAKIIDSGTRKSTLDFNIPISNLTNKIPLTHSQKRLWFLEKLNPEIAIANIPLAIKIKGQFNIDIFARSVENLINRHSILRTTFYETAGVPFQKILDSIELPIDHIKLEAGNDSGEFIKSILTEESNTIFDFELGPLFNIKIIGIESNEFILSFVQHHIISDGWSITLMVEEILTDYQNLISGISQKNNSLAIQFSDFAIWQNNAEWASITEHQMLYWKQKLTGANFILDLPTTFTRPAIKSFDGDHVSIVLDREINEAIQKYALLIDGTYFMVVEALLALLLAKYSGQDNILIGTPIANRNNIQTEKLIGFFANTIVIRNDISASDSLREYLENIKTNIIEAYSNQDLPFERLVEELQPERDMSYTPLFQVMIVLQNKQKGFNSKSDIELESYPIESKTTQFDMTLSIEEGEAESFVTLEYNTDLFSEEFIKTFLLRFEKLLLLLPKIFESKINEISLLSSEELVELENRWDDNYEKAKSIKPLHIYFAETVKNYPDQVALRYHNRDVTYKELDNLSDKLARHLKKLRISNESIVAVYVDKSVEYIISILGILKSGGAFLPIDINTPPGRIEYMLKDSSVECLIQSNNSLVDTKLSNSVIIEEVLSENDNDHLHESKKTVLEENLAYIIYTSGSTGKPKGVMITQKGISNLVKSQIKDFGITPKDKILQYASGSFDASVSEIFMAMLSGATLVLEKRENLISPIDLRNIIKIEKISVITLPPSVLSIIKPEDVKELNTIISAGEKITIDAAKKWAEKVNLINAYGPSETSIGATSENIINIENKPIPIGKPIYNSRIYILDENLNHLPNGIKGEIFISGTGLGRGYVGNPIQTAEKFIPDVYSKIAGERMYKTGDYGRLLENGKIEFIERIDNQVKIRGYRIELGEIESRINEMAEVQKCVVLVSEVNKNKMLRAFIVTSNELLDEEKINNHLKKILPEYMILNSYEYISSFPLTVNGKIDSAALLNSFYKEHENIEKNFVKAETTDEKIISSFFEDLLGLNKISIDESFFDLGGHSLLVMKLIYKISERYSIDIPIVSIFKNPTIRKIAEIIDSNEIEFDNLVPLNKSNSGKKMFLIHPSGGSIHWYTNLAEMLKTEYQVFGIQGDEYHISDKNYSLPLIANKYVKIILEEVGEEHIIIGGWSLGVAITIEIANQLDAIGRKPQHIFMLDQGPKIPTRVENDEDLMIVNTFKKSFHLDIDELKQMEYSDKMKFILKKAKKHKLVPIWIRLKDFEKYIKLLWLQNKAWQDYVPKKYNGGINLILSEENENKKLGWDNFIDGEIKISNVKGDHISMLSKNNAEYLVTAIQKTIES